MQTPKSDMAKPMFEERLKLLDVVTKAVQKKLCYQGCARSRHKKQEGRGASRHGSGRCPEIRKGGGVSSRQAPKGTRLLSSATLVQRCPLPRILRETVQEHE
jgi:hypothetical protein